jgi:hypothetical protein
MNYRRKKMNENDKLLYKSTDVSRMTAKIFVFLEIILNDYSNYMFEKIIKNEPSSILDFYKQEVYKIEKCREKIEKEKEHII